MEELIGGTTQTSRPDNRLAISVHFRNVLWRSQKLHDDLRWKRDLLDRRYIFQEKVVLKYVCIFLLNDNKN